MPLWYIILLLIITILIFVFRRIILELWLFTEWLPSNFVILIQVILKIDFYRLGIHLNVLLRCFHSQSIIILMLLPSARLFFFYKLCIHSLIILFLHIFCLSILIYFLLILIVLVLPIWFLRFALFSFLPLFSFLSFCWMWWLAELFLLLLSLFPFS